MFRYERTYSLELFWITVFCCLSLMILLPMGAHSQVLIPSVEIDSVKKKKDHPQMDVIDLYYNLLRSQKNRPARSIETSNFSVVPALGYSLQTGFAMALSANTAFYTKKNESKLSSILTSITYSQYNQIIVPLSADIWTKDDKYKFVTDCRFMKYPSITYGLGIHTKLVNGYSIDFDYVKIHQTVLKGLTRNLFAGLGYFYDHFWNIREVNPKTGVITDFERYGLRSKMVCSGAVVRALYDTRDNPINTLKGGYANILYRSNFTFLGSDNNFKSIQFEFRKFLKIVPRSDNVLALWSYNWMSLGSDKPPYLMLPSTGWDDFFNTGRGYIQGRYRGNDMLYLESEYRFNLLNHGLIGGVVFGNAQTFTRHVLAQPRAFALGAGAGLRIKINRFSGTNLCIDYGFGEQGSRGVAINLGEVF